MHSIVFNWIKMRVQYARRFTKSKIRLKASASERKYSIVFVFFFLEFKSRYSHKRMNLFFPSSLFVFLSKFLISFSGWIKQFECIVFWFEINFSYDERRKRNNQIFALFDYRIFQCNFDWVEFDFFTLNSFEFIFIAQHKSQHSQTDEKCK